MDKTYIERNQVVDRYLQGRLATDELNNFELYMLDNPDVVEEIEFARGMQRGLQQQRAYLSAEGLSASHRARFWTSGAYALAATALLFIAAGFSISRQLENNELRLLLDELRNPVVVAGEIWLEPIRGSRLVTANHEPGTALLLRVDVAAVPAASYVAEIRSAETGFALTQLQAVADQEQSIRLLVSNMPPGEYLVSVITDGSSGPPEPVAEYRFLLQRAKE